MPSSADPSDAVSDGAGALRWPEDAVEALLGVVADGVLVLDRTAHVVTCNPAAADALCAEGPEDLIGEDARSWRRIDVAGHPLIGTADPLAAEVLTGIDGALLGIVRRPGEVCWVRLWTAPLPHPELGPCTAVRIVPAQPPDPTRLLPHPRESLDVDALFGQRTVGMLRITPRGRVIQANDAAARLLGTSPTALEDQRIIDLVHPDDYEADFDNVRRLGRGEVEHHRSEVRLRGASGWVWARSGITAFHDDDGQVTNYIALLVDASADHPEGPAGERLAMDDPLTRLVSRHGLLRRLDDRLAAGGPHLAVVALNVDRFRAVNDSLGHAAADQVLIDLAARIRALLQPRDAAARLGGDDFVLLFDDVSTRAQASALVSRLLEAVREPLTVDGLTLTLSASAGVAMTDPLCVDNADEAIMHAHAALRAAKSGGRARFAFYDDDLAAANSNRLRIETSLRQALTEERLTVAYQPIRELESGRLAGAEALIRWADARLGPVAPDDFVPIAQDSGLVEPLTRLVLERGIAAASEWRRATGADVHVAINLTGQDLSRRELAQQVATALSARGLPPRALQLEIVETVLVEAGHQVRRNLEDLRDLGVGLGIDDFGTGYSSMAYLKQMPVDFVKIDRSFVTGLGTAREDTAIVRAVVGLAKSLELTVIAEGIETPLQLRILKELGCDLGQGYLIGHAEPSEALMESLRAGA